MSRSRYSHKVSKPYKVRRYNNDTKTSLGNFKYLEDACDLVDVRPDYNVYYKDKLIYSGISNLVSKLNEEDIRLLDKYWL